MSIAGLLSVLFALIAVLLLVLYGLQRRDLRKISELSQQLQRLAIGGRLPGRVEVTSDKPEVTALITAINHLLTRTGSPGERDAAYAPKLFTELGDRIHEAVLVHSDVILYANRQFASFVGVDRAELLGRRLADLVPPEYSELVSENIQRRLAGESAAERYEIDMVGLQGQMTRLEIASNLIEYDKGSALLITGVEILPTQTLQSLRLPEVAADPQALALDSLAEAIIATDRDGRITYMNPAAEQLTGTASDAAVGKLLEEIVSLVDETDRRLLSDPVHQALTSGAPVNLSRRALMLSRGNGSERSIELSASPIRNAARELTGAVVMLHDVTEMRGLTRQMSYQATHDALTGLVNRREFERRLEEAIEVEVAQHVLAVAAVTALDRLLEAPLELAPVDETGERIVRGLVGHLARQAAHLGDIVQHHDRTAQLARAVADRRCRQLDRALAAVGARQQQRAAAEIHRGAGGECLAHRVRQQPPVGLIDQAHDLLEQLACGRVGGAAGELLGRGVHVGDTAVLVGRDDGFCQ